MLRHYRLQHNDNFVDAIRWQQIQFHFHALLDSPSSERAALLAALAEQDADLASEVSRMLDEEERSDPLLDSELSALASELIDGSETIQGAPFGPYRLVKLLGEGGMGVVWLAEREDLGSQAAIKVLHNAALSPGRRRLFLSEQRTLAKLNHPSIARLYDAGALIDGTPYFVMEYVEGENLSVWRRQRTLSIQEILRLFRSICEAVQYAHSQAIIHRDLKPSNILALPDGSIKLLDFGIARRMADLRDGSDQSETTPWLMTPAYASPEQIRGEQAGIQTDVYSLGVILFELLTGHLPYNFTGCTPGQMEQLIEQQQPAAPSEAILMRQNGQNRLGKADAKDLDLLSLKAIHKDPSRRYASVEALIRDIDHYLKSEPIEARPDRFFYRMNRFVRRNRAGLVQAAIAIALILGLVGFYSVRLALARSRTLAEAARTQRIQHFMTTLFDGGDKDAGPSGDLRAVMLVDRGVLEASSLNADPETQAELYRTLADIYGKLGKYNRAEPLLRSALNLRQAHEGERDPTTADDIVALGLLRIQQAHVQEGEDLIRKGLAIDKQELPPDDPQTARALSALGHALVERGDYDHAVPILNEAIGLQSKRNSDSSGLAESLNNLAEVEYYLGHYDKAANLNQQTIAIERQLYGNTHPRIADNLVNLGEIQHDLGKDDEAEKYYRQALEIEKSWYGEIHPDTATCMEGVAQSLIYRGRYDEAAPLLQRALQIQEQVYGKTHPQVAIALNQVGVFELRRKRMDAALADFTRMAEINRAAYGDSHYLVGVSLLNIGEVYFEEGNLLLAEKYFRDALNHFIKQLPSNHPNIGIAQVKLGKVQVIEHKYREAEGHLTQGLDVLTKLNPLPSDRIQSAKKDLETVHLALH